jgi:pyruvate dehydrogenase E2 component (dihydrolipoamide acetyltransferase)
MRVTPVARRIADDNNLNLSTIQGSGPQGRIIKRDVLQAIEASKENQAAVPPSAMVPAMATHSQVTHIVTPVSSSALVAGDHTTPLTPMRQTIARRLVESKTTIPHYQVTMKFNMDPLLDLRKSLNEQLANHEVKLSVNDFLVRGCALTMADHPDFNASFGGDHILYHGQVNIGVAISLPPEKGGGLVVATIRDADLKSLRLISAETKVLAEKARTRGLTVEEMSDATFTLSNLGMFGVEHFTAIINPPNSAILAVGASVELPVVRDGQIVVGHDMQGTLSLDHRVIDGAMAAQYMQALKELIETPTMLLV